MCLMGKIVVFSQVIGPGLKGAGEQYRRANRETFRRDRAGSYGSRSGSTTVKLSLSATVRVSVRIDQSPRASDRVQRVSPSTEDKSFPHDRYHSCALIPTSSPEYSW